MKKILIWILDIFNFKKYEDLGVIDLSGQGRGEKFDGKEE